MGNLIGRFCLICALLTCGMVVGCRSHTGGCCSDDGSPDGSYSGSYTGAPAVYGGAGMSAYPAPAGPAATPAYPAAAGRAATPAYPAAAGRAATPPMMGGGIPQGAR
jgi:hypothetical protein